MIFRILFTGITRKAINLQETVPSHSSPQFLSTERFAASVPSQYLLSHNKLARTPWHEQNVSVNGTEHSIFDIPATGDTQADVFLMSGCGSHSRYYKDEINECFSQKGIRTFATQQVRKSNYPDNIERNINYVDWLLLDSDSPLQTRDKSRPLFVLTNSSTATLIENVYLDAEKAEFINQNVSYFFDTAPFFDTANSSIIHKFQDAADFEKILALTLSEIYGRHAENNRDITIGDHWKDKVAMRFLGSKKGNHDMQAEIANATHGEALDYRNMGRHATIVNEGLSPHHPARQKLGTFYISNNDPAACSRSAHYFAKLKGDAVYVFNTTADSRHNPFKESQAVRNDIARIMRAFIAHPELMCS